ncbi:MAG: hypothetical protein A2Y17_10085 [Clostridiales bacterium GWF2_38_85]|nr:MAG: hypothetical protein A2Y17_10085 [Clostridiales bacterium GWF2_38_85]HBL84466.1 hypothetical protein [Clostridiales bacterium]
MADSTRFSKRIFAILLEKAKGERSWRQFSIDCGISYVQLRKLAQATQENPPRPKLIKKIADNSFDVYLEDYMFSIGITPNDNRKKGVIADESTARKSTVAAQPELVMERYKSMTMKQRRLVEEFCEFLCEKNKKENSKD